ncbi:Gamma-glutamyltranspeptidase protein [Spiribacter salinus M19-40]|uniref:Gamma-glutamyltranspeptidase protein n=1 Tax=Spiribacter salinus M19-40 TaxID=1260251 RepID=R4VI10_9GAMM|nr:gamma-glutamyltransferase [Spiribacter salinus]AGM40247.1 Gamma-glutamyltranspeptidase protein [Spiribacter salinus M19-40]
MITAPHHLATEAGRDVLREGGTAVEAMVTAAAVIAVVYPHMNAIGGDGFWLLGETEQRPVGIDACGPAAGLASRDWYHAQGLTTIPARGPLAALTVPGAIGGWAAALAQPNARSKPIPLARLLAPAVALAREGVPTTAGQEEVTRQKLEGLQDIPGFAETFLHQNLAVPQRGERLVQRRLGDTLEQLGRAGLTDFYQGDVARSLARDLEALGSPLRLDDLIQYAPRVLDPLSITSRDTQLYNMPPPTQGIASLMILGVFDRLQVPEGEGFAHIHGLIEATKQAFRVRDAEVTDPDWMRTPATDLLDARHLDAAAAAIDPQRAAPWPHPGTPGDTVWMGAIDANGQAVSFIQSIYWEFGAGVVLPETGVLMQNRGMSFGLTPNHPQALEPGRRPFHTLNPAMATFADGRHMVYGTMGGEGQPQTQAAIFTRHARFGMPLQDAVNAPRWLLGRTWGESTTGLKVESRLSASLIDALSDAGHPVEVVEPLDSMMGHAGAIVRHPNGVLEGASDPRSDGAVATV